ncbi:MAG: hypothetical protein NC548_24470 [Lachnospiraceae bacterium]|nr:hypothetical protein [Lachnospiraceae bacterium]
MKHLATILLAVSLALSFASCSSTRKVANDKQQTHITEAVVTDTHAQSQTSEAVEQRRTDIDLSNVVIDFTKIEYADGTQTVTTNANDVQRDTVKQRDREVTEPPNVAQNIKSVTSGRVTINNDKKTEVETSVKSDDKTQTETNTTSNLTEDTTSQTKTEDKEKRGFFFYVGVTTCAILLFVLLLCLSYFAIRQKLKKK